MARGTWDDGKRSLPHQAPKAPKGNGVKMLGTPRLVDGAAHGEHPDERTARLRRITGGRHGQDR